MKGLIVKELIEFKKRWIITVIIFLIVSIYSVTVAFPVCIIMTPLFSVVVFGSFTHDEQSKWLQYSIAMPYGRTRFVSSKYLAQLLALLFSLVVITLLWVVSSIKNGNFNTELFGVILWAACVAGLIYPMMLIPVSMAFSSNASRLFFIIVNGVIGGLSGATIADESFLNTFSTSKITSITPLVILAIIAAMYLLSWGISIKIYEKRDL